MENRYLGERLRGPTGNTGMNGGTGNALSEEEIQKLKHFLADALTNNKDVAIPEEILNNLRIFQDFVEETCTDWTNRQILENLVVRKIFTIYGWLRFASQAELFWETHEVVGFVRSTVLTNAPIDEKFVEYLSQQNDLTQNEKESFYSHRSNQIPVQELIRLGFMGTEYLGLSNRYLDVRHLVINNAQTTQHLQFFLEHLFRNILRDLKNCANDDYLCNEYPGAIEAISIFSKFNLKIEKPNFWRKMMLLIDDEELKQKLETLVS
jgi:hypothetical protein